MPLLKSSISEHLRHLIRIQRWIRLMELLITSPQRSSKESTLKDATYGLVVSLCTFCCAESRLSMEKQMKKYWKTCKKVFIEWVGPFGRKQVLMVSILLRDSFALTQIKEFKQVLHFITTGSLITQRIFLSIKSWTTTLLRTFNNLMPLRNCSRQPWLF